MQNLLVSLTHQILAPAVTKKWLSKPILPFRRYLGLYEEAFESGVGIGYAHRNNLVAIVRLISDKGREEEVMDGLRHLVQNLLSEVPDAAKLCDLAMFHEEDRLKAVVRQDWMLKTSACLSEKDLDTWADKYEMPINSASGNLQLVLSLGIALGGAFPKKAEQLWMQQYEEADDEDLQNFMRDCGLHLPAYMPKTPSLAEFSEQWRVAVKAFRAETQQ